jgi:hypothetical protein
MLPADDPAPHEARFFEDPDVLGDGVQGDPMLARQIGDASLTAPPELRQDPPPGGMAQREENAIERGSRLITHKGE